MEITKKVLEEQLNGLHLGRQKIMDDLISQDGAIQFCERLLNMATTEDLNSVEDLKEKPNGKNAIS